MERKRGKHGCLITFLIVLFVLVGVPYGYLLLAGFSYDDPSALLAAAPIPSAQRYVFHAAERTVDIAVDKGDLYFVASLENMLGAGGEVDKALAEYGLSLRKTGLEITEDGVYAAVKLVWKGFVPLQIRARLTVEKSGAEILVRVREAWLGKWIRLPLDEKLDLETALLYTFDPAELHSRLERLENLRMEDGRLLFTCGVGDEIVNAVTGNIAQVEEYARYLGPQEPLALANAFKNGDEVGIDAFYRAFENDAAYFVAFRLDALAIAEDFKAQLYLMADDGRYLPRFFPEIVSEKVAARSAEYDAVYVQRRTELTDAASRLQDMYVERKITTDGKAFLLNDAEKAPLTLPLLAEDEGAFAWLDLSQTRIVYGLGGNYYMTYKVPMLKDMPKENARAFPGMNIYDVYVPLILARLPDGSCVTVLHTAPTSFRLQYAEEEQFEKWLSTERIPVINLFS